MKKRGRFACKPAPVARFRKSKSFLPDNFRRATLFRSFSGERTQKIFLCPFVLSKGRKPPR
ncbi:MAG: hypothetical protein RR258_06640, partial [Alistipes sp.]